MGFVNNLEIDYEGYMIKPPALLCFPFDSFIQAESIKLGKDFKIGRNVRIVARGPVVIGDYCKFGDNVDINAEEITIGNHFFHYTPGLRVGGGGSQFVEAVLKIGDRCVVHNNYINLAREVVLGNDVGLSPDVDIITHGFWQSMLEGYPAKYGSVFIDDGVIVGQRTMILPGVVIRKNIVIGANSTVTKDLTIPKSIYAGNPARHIRDIVEPSLETKTRNMLTIVYEYIQRVGHKEIDYEYPIINLHNAIINVETQTLTGQEDEDTDKLRDHLRRYGIRIYTERPFLSL